MSQSVRGGDYPERSTVAGGDGHRAYLTERAKSPLLRPRAVRGKGGNISEMRLGVLVGNTRFPRVLGDAGNPASYSYPVSLRVIQELIASRVTKPTPDLMLLQPLIEGARQLEYDGVQAITTSCGLLAPFQEEIARRVEVPFFASSLLQIPLVYKVTGRPVGVITAVASALGPDHLHASGVDASVPIIVGGLEECEAYASTFLGDRPTLDRLKVEREIVNVSQELLNRRPEIGAFVFECHNLPPYSDAVRRATNRPVYDIFSLIAFVLQGLADPRDAHSSVP